MVPHSILYRRDLAVLDVHVVVRVFADSIDMLDILAVSGQRPVGVRWQTPRREQQKLFGPDPDLPLLDHLPFLQSEQASPSNLRGDAVSLNKLAAVCPAEGVVIDLSKLGLIHHCNAEG